MFKRFSLLAAALAFAALPVSAAEVNNVGLVLAVGKVSANACRIKIAGANFAGVCPTAVYQEVYFTCNSTEGKEFLSIALAAHISERTVRVTSDACSIYGSSVANVVGVNLES